MFVVLTQDDENIAILIYEQEITWMQLFWIRQCQFLLELLWILFTTSHQLALHEWKFRFIYFCNCKIIFFLSLVEKFRRHFCPKYCFGSRVFFFFTIITFCSILLHCEDFSKSSYMIFFFFFTFIMMYNYFFYTYITVNNLQIYYGYWIDHWSMINIFSAVTCQITWPIIIQLA